MEFDYLLRLELIGDKTTNKSAILLRYVDDVWNDNIAPLD